jgi:peptide/nickel transport system substrate-binding protein
MNKITRSFGPALALVLAVAWAAPWPAQAQQSVFRAAYTTNPPTLDAILSTTTAARQIAIYLFESLVVIGEGYEVIPQLADKWEISKDGKTYDFTLRSGVKFHNGKTLTAEDVTASFNRFKQSPLGKKGLSVADSIVAVNARTVRFNLNKDSPLLGILTIPIPFPAVMPKEIVDKYGQNEVKGADLIGTGPYKLIDWKPDVAIRLARFADYAVDNRFDGPSGFGGKRVANFDEVQIIPVTEAAARLAGLETGEFDFAESLPLNAYDRLVENKDTVPAIQKPKWGIMINVNKAVFPTSEAKFRRALAYAVDKEQVMKAITLGRKEFYRIQNSIYFPEQKDWYIEDGQAEYNKYDVAKAKQLLQEVGYKGEEVVYISNRDYDWMYKASLPLVQQWKDAGINVKLVYYDWPSGIQKQREKSAWNLFQTGWSTRMDPTMQLQTFDGSGNSQASHWYKSPQMDKLMEAINKGAPLKVRQAAWNKVQQLFWQELPFIRIGDYHELEAVRANVKGYRPFYVTPRFWGVTK